MVLIIKYTFKKAIYARMIPFLKIFYLHMIMFIIIEKYFIP